jgi:tartrate-resistant acid phosphatase type 5
MVLAYSSPFAGRKSCRFLAREFVTFLRITVSVVFFLILLGKGLGYQAYAQSETIRFAVIGDYGKAGQPERDVSNLVKSWNPDLIITVGDNNYSVGSASTIDQNIGQYYHEFISPYVGSYGAGATVNRFFPTLGNHDWGNVYPNPAGAQPYLNYFSLPNNERYYDFVRGPVHFFALDSDPNEPDGVRSTSVQANWLQTTMAASSAPWKIVYLHHSPYSSGSHGSNVQLQWPFQAWGANAVMAGHDHDYERLSIDGFPYFVNGLGGASKYAFGTAVPGSQVRYNSDFGAMLVEASNESITFKFITRAGIVIDTYTATKTTITPDSLALNPTPVTGTQSSVATVTLAEPAPAGGVMVNFSSSSTAVATVPASAIVAEGTTAQSLIISTKAVAVPTQVDISATSGGVARTATLTVVPPVLAALGLSPLRITAPCKTATGKVTLNAKAPAGGVVINLSNTNAAVTVPTSVTIPAGATYKTFTVSAPSAVSVSESGSVTATPADPNFGTSSFSKVLTVLPVGVKTLALSPNPVTGTNIVNGTVTLVCPAPAGGVVVTLTSGAKAIANPTVSAITIPEGQTVGMFTITTAGVATTSYATITAKANGIAKSVKLTVSP